MPEIKIEITDKLSGEDWRALTTWREHVFSPEGIGTDWIGGKWHIRAAANEEAIGHIGFDIYPLEIDGKEILCVGVGAVVVVPKYQGQRLPLRMFGKLRDWRDEKDSRMPLVLCCPKPLVNYYKRHNFTEIGNDVYYLQKGNYEKSKFEFMADKPISNKGNVYIPSNPW
jgi:GNAT superfamily N-acetyltransferase